MKTTTIFLILFLTGLDLWAQTAPSNLPPNLRRPMPRRFGTNSVAPRAFPNFPAATSAAPRANPRVPAVSPPRNVISPANAPAATPPAAAPQEEMIPPGDINFQGVDVNQVLDVYARLVNRTILRAGLPAAQIVLKTETPLTKTEAIQALQAVLALNGISLVNVGDKFVKALPIDQANTAGAPFSDKTAEQLPDLGSYVTHIVQLKYVKPTEMVPIIQPFAKLPNSILPIDSNGILVLRDNAENVKRMLEMIAKVDVEVPEEIISEVIPIRYALAEDIANALNGLGNGGSTISIGSSATSTRSINGTSSRGNSFGGQGSQNSYQNQNQNQYSGMSQMSLSVTPMDASVAPMALNNGTPTGGTSFQQRLQSIIQRASGSGKNDQQDQIQVLGTTKIIADQRSNSLLVFATKEDMARIQKIVAKLDVLLAQVLIESVIMDVGFNNSLNLGVSAAQNPQTYSPNQQIVGGGGSVNSSTFFNFLSGNNSFDLGTNSSSVFGNVLPGGFSYFGNIGPNWDVALQAAASDGDTRVIQRPRIQTSQAKPASFFVGQTVPYVTSTSYGGVGYAGGASYSQLSVGVELDVTPFINPDGLVVMDINQEIDDLNGSTFIEGVGDIPNTTKRTFSSEIAVKDRDTIILGGFVRSDKSTSKSGVPLLEDIPILGALFSQRSNTKDRDETLVLIRPTVLRTPDIAAAQAIEEEQRLPGIAHAQADDEAEAQEQIQAERKEELRKERATKHAAGVFTVEPTNPNVISTNSVPQPNPATDLY